MPVVLGLASSHAPSMFSPAEAWPQIHQGLTRDVAQPKKLAEETPEVIGSYVQRIKSGFADLKATIVEEKIDLVVLVGDDQTEVFSNACVPAIAIFVGESTTGTTSISWIGEKHEDNHVRLKGSPDIARKLVKDLIKRDFDPAYIEQIVPLGRPAAGIGHAFARVAKAVGIADSEMPIISIFLNGYHPPLPTGKRCYALGKTLRDFFADRPERVAIYASGGMSHCPAGPRAGWIDEPLDRWILQRIESGHGDELQNLFTFDSDTLRSGTGELRAWITVAGAFEGKHGKIVDYIPACHAVTGLGFVKW